MPSIADNALVKAAPYIERLGAFEAEPQLIPEVEGLLAALLGEVPPAAEALARAREVAPLAGELIEPLLGLTVAPTKARASDKRNVIPALCEITIDVRLLPGQTPEDAAMTLRAWLGNGDYELVSIERFGGTRRRWAAPALGRGASVRGDGGAGRGRCTQASPASIRTALGCARRSARSPTASSVTRDGHRDRGAPDPLGQRAGAGRRPRSSACAGSGTCARRLRLIDARGVQLAGAFESLDAYLAAEPARGSSPTSTSATASRSSFVANRRLRRPAGARPLLAARLAPATSRGQPVRLSGRLVEPSWSPVEYAAAVEEVREAIARGDVYQVNLVHLSAAFAGSLTARRTRSHRSIRCTRAR
jgi:hypothetical protein